MLMRKEEHVSNKDKSQIRKDASKHSQKSRRAQSEGKRSPSSITARRDCINKRIETLIKEQQKREESKNQQESQSRKVCINRKPRFIVDPTRDNATSKSRFSSKVRAQHPSVRRQCSSDRRGMPSSPKRQSVKVEEIKIEQVKRR